MWLLSLILAKIGFGAAARGARCFSSESLAHCRQPVQVWLELHRWTCGSRKGRQDHLLPRHMSSRHRRPRLWPWRHEAALQAPISTSQCSRPSTGQAVISHPYLSLPCWASVRQAVSSAPQRRVLPCAALSAYTPCCLKTQVCPWQNEKPERVREQIAPESP